MFVGGYVRFSVVATGPLPLTYQWSFYGTNIGGATNTSLILTNVQLSQAGNYTVLVSNVYGSTLSSNAVLTVNVPPPCTYAPSGMISWWRAEGNALDSIGTNNGTLGGGMTFDTGEVGQGFETSSNGYVVIPVSSSLNNENMSVSTILNVGLLNGFTVEMWVNPTAFDGDFINLAEWETLPDGYLGANLQLYGAGSIAGLIQITPENYGTLNSPNGVVVTNCFQHVAMTYDKTSGIMTLYCNGTNVARGHVGTMDDFTMGGHYPHPYNLYLGIWEGRSPQMVLDEISIYNRALSSNEIAAIYNAGNGGKCTSPAVPPLITQQPTNQTVYPGGTATFSITVSTNSTMPLSYQWYFNSGVLTNKLTNATSATLTMTNVQPNQAGTYWVVVTNVAGSATSSNAVLVVRAVSPVKVNPGTNQMVILNGTSVTITLNGSFSGGALTVTSLWTEAAGPANAVFTNATSLGATVTFTNIGNYLLRLTAGDGYSSDSGTVIISVVNNQAPVVNAGPNRIIAPSNTVYLNGSVSDDGLPLPPSLSSWWSVVSGPVTNGITFTNATLPVTVASNFTTLGVYTLRLTATDGLATNSSDMTVTVADPSSRTYTFDADFAEGELVNVNYDDVPDQLQLNQTVTPFPFVWVACSYRGTMVRIDANTGQIYGEYRTTPETIWDHGDGVGPSRTTVDRYGNVWVGNRNDNLGGTNGSITRVGLVIGGTRGYKTNDKGGTNYTFMPDPNGEYLQPPFKYCTAIDRDGDGLIHTSSGLGDIFGWDTNKVGSNDCGGVSLADDELHHQLYPRSFHRQSHHSD